MNNFLFENATKTIFGRGCVKEYLACFAGRYGKNVLLCYGGGSIRRSGIYDEVTASLAKAGKNVAEFSGIHANLTYSTVQEGAALARRHAADWILGVGGDSVLSCCKAISLAAVYKGDLWKDFWARPGVIGVNPLPVGAVVTAAGTGGGMNGSAAILNEAQHMKICRTYPQCSPKFALLDPSYTFGVPRSQLLCGGFNTLARLMEIYFSAPDTPNVSDDLAEALMCSVVRDLRAAVQDPLDYNARSNLLWEAAMAENCMLRLGKKTDPACRQMAWQLSAFTGCGSEEGLAVLYPVYCRHVCESGAAKFARFAGKVWGLSGEDKTEQALARAGVEAFAAFVRELGLPASLRGLSVNTEKLDLKQLADSCALPAGGYRQMTHEELCGIFRECL